MKKCSKCHNLLSLNKFHKDNKSKDGLFAYCKECSYQVTFVYLL